jgi:protein-disulfide isomerase
VSRDLAIDLGTPTLFINGQRIADPTNFEVVAKAIDEALGKASG